MHESLVARTGGRRSGRENASVNVFRYARTDRETADHEPLAKASELWRLSDRGGLGPVLWLRTPETVRCLLRADNVRHLAARLRPYRATYGRDRAARPRRE